METDKINHLSEALSAIKEELLFDLAESVQAISRMKQKKYNDTDELFQKV